MHYVLEEGRIRILCQARPGYWVHFMGAETAALSAEAVNNTGT